MSKVKYRYNPDTLNYDQVEVGSKERFLRFTIMAGIVIILTTIATFLVTSFIPTVKEKKQERQLTELRGQIDQLHGELDKMAEVLTDLEYRDDNIYRVVFEAEPVPDGIRNGGIGGVNRRPELKQMTDSELLIGTWRRLDSMAVQLYQQSRSYDEIIKLARKKEEMLASIPAIQPISNEDLTRIASGFGWRIHPIYKTQKMHNGIDFSAPTGIEIYATGDGVATIAGSKGNGYGLYVVLDHGFTYQTLYGHMSEVLVEEGQVVKRGQIIGKVGSTGTSVAPHLHYEVHKNGKPIDPINFFYSDLTPEQYQELIRMAAHANQSFD